MLIKLLTIRSLCIYQISYVSFHLSVGSSCVSVWNVFNPLMDLNEMWRCMTRILNPSRSRNASACDCIYENFPYVRLFFASQRNRLCYCKSPPRALVSLLPSAFLPLNYVNSLERPFSTQMQNAPYFSLFLVECAHSRSIAVSLNQACKLFAISRKGFFQICLSRQ